MKIVAEEDNIWLILEDKERKNLPDEVIVDRKKKDIRVRLGNTIIKIQFKTEPFFATESKITKLTGILINDIYIWKTEKGVD